MWTNVFKIGGFHKVSWFQFLPHESELIPLSDKSVKDSATQLVVSSHIQLQKEGFLSTWTNSFVGPWDPSQGLHNPDEKIKLWLFLPGRHLTVADSAQAAVSKLKVVASGLWISPGDSEEVATALSQALRNRIERALSGLTYMRFGDVFSKFHPSQSEELLRRGQPTVEFIFAASEEGIFVHALIAAKHIRALSSDDSEKLLKHSSKNSGYGLPVIVSPHGICGRLTGCVPSDLVKQVYFSSSNLKTLNSFIGLPNHVSQGSSCQLRGQNCYFEVTLGCPRPESDRALPPYSNSIRNVVKRHLSESPSFGRGDQKLSDNSSVYEKTFIYPAEAVLAPTLQVVRSSLKRVWLQNWFGPSMPGSSFFMLCSDNIEAMEECSETNGIRTRYWYNSSSNSNSSSVSSISSSSDSDFRMGTGASELEADADSLTCRQSGLSFNDRLGNDISKLGFKRPRDGMAESFPEAGTTSSASLQDTFNSGFGSMEVNNSAITIEQIGSHWDWNVDDRAGTDIHALINEFGEFGDLFENDVLTFGEPPGTAESQALMFSAPDCSDVVDNSVGVMDVTDQLMLSEGFTSFDSFIPPPPAAIEETFIRNQEAINSALSSGPVNCSSASNTSEFDHIIKAEALMTFASEYGAVETPTSEVSSSIFRSPYLPQSRKVESSNSSSSIYTYGPAPPSSCFDGSDEKTGMPVNSKPCPGKNNAGNILRLKDYYTHVENGKEQQDRRLLTVSNGMVLAQDGAPSPFPILNSTNAVKAAHRKITEGTFESENPFLSMRTILATEIECILFQTSMCRIRHTLLSSSSLTSSGFNKLPGDPSVMPENISGKYELKRKESIPIRIAGDIDGGMVDGHLNAPVGVWRSVDAPRVSKPASSSSMEISSSLPHTSFIEESMLSYGHKQPLQELLDGFTLLIQQATSFVDLALDSDCGDGPYGWLALQEQWRKGFSCGPSMVHAGCGGTLASCHSLDIAGVELVDPLSADIHASSVISLLQSDIKTALKSAFGNLDGPLSVTDWCKGRNQSGENTVDGYSAESTMSECRDSSSIVAPPIGEPLSPSPSCSAGSTSIKVSSAMDGTKVDETSQRRSNQENFTSESDLQMCSRLRPTLFVIPFPAILVGYQDDWLKTSANSLQLWEKAPLEPYALQKPINYYVICPDIDPLTSAAADFFQQLGTVYETCKLGTHLPQTFGNQMEVDSGRKPYPGFVLLDCPQRMKIESRNTSLLGSISDYFHSLSTGWDLTSYLKSLSKALKALKLGHWLSTNAKEGCTGASVVIYVVCPFPEPIAVLQTIIESSVAIGSVIFQSDRERRSILCSQVSKALSYSATVDEASISNILVLPGFNLPRLVLQIVTVDAIFKVTNPSLNELVILKETAFTVYNKARRISRGASTDAVQSSSLSSRSHTVLTQMSSSSPGMWKDCVGPRITGHSLPREGEIDASLRAGSWDSSWQATRTGAVSCDPNRTGDIFSQDDTRYMFEPLFILSEPGSVERAFSPLAFGNLQSETSKPLSDENSGGFMQSASMGGSADSGSGSQTDGSESDKTPPSLHCCYGWTEDWRWLICIWTDSRGELLDSHIFPFGGISSRQDTKGLECLFVQVLQQGCQILQACSSDTGVAKPRDFVIARIGSFYELEYQEWQKAINAVGGSEVKKWNLQLRRSVSDGMSAGSNGPSLQQQEMSLIQERTLPSSPGPLYGSSHQKISGYMKGGLGQPSVRKQLMGTQLIDSSRTMLQWVQSISFVTIAIDHSLHLVFQADTQSPPGAQGGYGVGSSGYLEGFTPVKSLGSTPASYILIPSPSMRFLPPTPLQLPTCLTAESPPLAHLLHSKGSAIPVSTCFVVSKAVPSMRKDYRSNLKEEWPSTLLVSLIDHYGGNNFSQEKPMRGNTKQVGRSPSSEARELEFETHVILESLAAELHALSWMTASPAYLERRSALPFHCDMVLRLTRLLHFADKDLSRQYQEKAP